MSLRNVIEYYIRKLQCRNAKHSSPLTPQKSVQMCENQKGPLKKLQLDNIGNFNSLTIIVILS